MLTAIQSRPIGVSVDATNWSAYKSGIFTNCGAATLNTLNHDVLLVGVSAANEWKVKNSWGAAWGESGFIRLTGGNICGICLDVSPWPV
jgi:C1A family cysteine protease